MLVFPLTLLASCMVNNGGIGEYKCKTPSQSQCRGVQTACLLPSILGVQVIGKVVKSNMPTPISLREQTEIH